MNDSDPNNPQSDFPGMPFWSFESRSCQKNNLVDINPHYTWESTKNNVNTKIPQGIYELTDRIRPENVF